MSGQTPTTHRIAAVILAAGRSTRMRSRLPKPLHPICGRPLTWHVAEACRAAGVERTIIVIGHEADAVRTGLGEDWEYAIQREQLGSGDAARSASPALRGFEGTVLVLAGDVPLLRPETIGDLLTHHHKSGAAATLLTAVIDDPTGYGRIVRNSNGSVARIVEHRDANEQERAIKEWNPSLYAFQSCALFEALEAIRPNNLQGELYLTDAIGVLTNRGQCVEAMTVADPNEVLGVNTRIELAAVTSIMRRRILDRLMLAGVTVVDPATTYVDIDVQVGQDTELHPQSFLLARTVIGEDCRIGPFARLDGATVGNRCTIVASTIRESALGDGVKVGPYANIRPGCRIGDGAKVGDFVELNRSDLGPGVSAAHLTYIGDSEVGAGANIGAGTITCNYDGRKKHKTVIGPGAFIGSHTTLIAPVKIGDGAVTAAGSVITDEVPEGALAIARQRQTIKPGWAARRAKGE